VLQVSISDHNAPSAPLVMAEPSRRLVRVLAAMAPWTGGHRLPNVTFDADEVRSTC
jgi:hypothetical protein